MHADGTKIASRQDVVYEQFEGQRVGTPRHTVGNARKKRIELKQAIDNK
jgi:hypothetical protein